MINTPHTISMNDFDNDSILLTKEFVSGPSKGQGYKRMSAVIHLGNDYLTYNIKVDKADTNITCKTFAEAIERYNEL